MRNYFETKEEAQAYKEAHEMYVVVPEYLPCVQKWALVFPLKACLEVE